MKTENICLRKCVRATKFPASLLLTNDNRSLERKIFTQSIKRAKIQNSFPRNTQSAHHGNIKVAVELGGLAFVVTEFKTCVNSARKLDTSKDFKMPLDTRRINGPESSSSYTDFAETSRKCSKLGRLDLNERKQDHRPLCKSFDKGCVQKT